MTKTSKLAAWAVALALTGGAAAEAKNVRYAGVHPRTGKPEGGLCYIQAVHVHSLPPSNADVLYRMHNGVYFFIGDPTPFRYDGEKHAYYGHHPVVVNVVLEEDAKEDHVEYCYLDGPHYHAYPPPPGRKFVEKEDVHYYADEYPEEYNRGRPALAKVNVVYRPWLEVRPVVVEAPPPQYHGPIFDVHVAVPAPHLGVNVAVPVLEVGHVHHHHCGHTDVVIVRDRPHGHGHGHGHGRWKHGHGKGKWKH